MPRPGSRRTGRISDDRYVWCKTTHGDIGVFVRPAGTDEDSQIGEHVAISFKLNDGRGWHLNLSSLTATELQYIREVINTGLDWAEPICLDRDREANDAYEAGDDSFARNYRPLPRIFHRKGFEYKHRESVQLGSEDVSANELRPADPDDGVRGAGSVVAEHDSIDRGTSDDEPKTG